MKTHAALVSKLSEIAIYRDRPKVTPEMKALCELFDAYRELTDEALALTGKRLDELERKLAGKPSTLAFQQEQG